MKKQHKHPILKTILHTVLMAVFLVGMALLLAWYIQYRYMGDDADATWVFFANNPGLYWYSFGVVLSILLILSALVRPFLAVGVTSSAIIALMFANQYKFAVQNVPLLPEDLQMTGNAGDLTRFVDGDHLTRTIIAIVLILGLSIFLTILSYRYWTNKQTPWWRRHGLIQRAVVLVGGGMTLGILVSNLLEQANYAHREEPASWCGITEFHDYNPALIVEQLGFVSGFIYNLTSSQIEEPANYSEATMRTLAMKYNAKQQEGNKERKPLRDTVDKIIVVLSESSYDPSIIKDIYPYGGGDVTPELHKIAQTSPHGLMFSTAYGGGTANVEFEVDTGLSNYWEQTTPFSNLVPYVNHIPAIANTAKNAGFYTATVHTFGGHLYKRSIALPKEGFDDFFTDADISYSQINTGDLYINDYSAYHELFDRIKNNDDKQMFGLITMQNHAPYDRAYGQVDFMPLNNDGNPSEDPEDNLTANYYQSLHSSDQALGEFIKAVDSLDQRTVVLWYGDHAGGVLSRIVENENPTVQNLAYQTPYFVHANFDLDTKDLQLPTTSPNCLVNTMYNLLNVQKSAFNYLLDDVCTQHPVLSRTYRSEDNQSQQQSTTGTLRDYELTNYDILNGQQYWMKYSSW